MWLVVHNGCSYMDCCAVYWYGSVYRSVLQGVNDMDSWQKEAYLQGVISDKETLGAILKQCQEDNGKQRKRIAELAKEVIGKDLRIAELEKENKFIT